MTLSPEKKTALVTICNADEGAAKFLGAFIVWCHWIDDLIDKDTLWLPQDVVKVNLEALLAFTENEFFQRHKEKLMPMIVSSFAAYADSNLWEKREDVRDRRAADILKSYYHEVIWQVAYICGGWDHMRATTAKGRIFDYDFKG